MGLEPLSSWESLGDFCLPHRACSAAYPQTVPQEVLLHEQACANQGRACSLHQCSGLPHENRQKLPQLLKPAKSQD